VSQGLNYYSIKFKFYMVFHRISKSFIHCHS